MWFKLAIQKTVLSSKTKAEVLERLNKDRKTKAAVG